MDFQPLHSLNESQTEIQPYLEKKHYTLCSKNFHAIQIDLIWNHVRSDLINDSFLCRGSTNL